MTGAMRYPAMLGSEVLSGLENAATLPEQALDWLGRTVPPLLGGRPAPPLGGFGNGNPYGSLIPTPGDVQRMSDQVGLTNNPALTPGLGPYPETERLGAAAAQGLGGALLSPGTAIPKLLQLGAGALGGATGEGVTQATGSPLLGTIAGAGAGLTAGGIGTAFRSAEPGVAAVVSNITNQLGAPNATPFQAGLAVQNELMKSRVLAATGLGPGTALPDAVVDKILGTTNPPRMPMQPIKVTDSLLKDPQSLQVLRQESPDVTNQIAAAMLNRNAPQWNKLPPESQDPLLTSQDHQDALESALAASKVKRPSPMSITGGLGIQELGTGLGAYLAHRGLIPGGDVFGGVAGALTALNLTSLKSHAMACAIVDPWVMQSGAAGGLGSYSATATQP